jgi:hypothetical protein
VDDLSARCGSACDPANKDHLYSELHTTNIALGIGAGALVVAVTTWFVLAPSKGAAARGAAWAW